jgi:hypothetical protein
MKKTCVKCEGNLRTPEVIFWEKELRRELPGEQSRKNRNKVCSRCHYDYWGGIESIFNQFEMDKEEVFFMIITYIQCKIEDEELSKEEVEKYISQRKRIFHIPY